MPKTGESSASREEKKIDTNSVLLQELSALRLAAGNMTTQQIPTSLKFHIADDYDRWKSQARRYLRVWELAKQQYLLLSLVDKTVYDQIHQEVPEDVTDKTLDMTRFIVVPPDAQSKFTGPI
ncbi:unnamed protein product [Echinostoma caproni]|uniref:Gag-pol polyprotein n=1 Tax=Echinostoma caproni TaxID=27848 RepID=A0A183ARS6_9TREM|nr:unnamed protein product [Echinostoma caproni]